MKKLLLTLASLALLSTSLYAGCTADVDMDGNKITDLGAPTAGTDATNKDYVDNKFTLSETNITSRDTAKWTSDAKIRLKAGIGCTTGSITAVADMTAGTKLAMLNTVALTYSNFMLKKTDGTVVGYTRSQNGGEWYITDIILSSGITAGTKLLIHGCFVK
jgi:hypothetical protein